MDQSAIALMLVSLFLGIVLAELVRLAQGKYSVRRELSENQKISLEGDDWIALWQAAADGEEVLNFEEIVIVQSGSQIWMKNREKSPDNPKGGYKWQGKLEFSHGETLMGSYYSAAKENNTNRGIMYFTYDSTRRLFLGRWVGKAIDGPFSSGFVVISKNKKTSKESLDALLERARNHPVNIISMDFLKPPKAA